MAYYLMGNSYDRTLRTQRREYARRVREMRKAILKEFPGGTRVSDPRGGYVLWVELPRRVKTLELYEEARNRGVVYAPGPLFSAGKRYAHCLRGAESCQNSGSALCRKSGLEALPDAKPS